MASLLALSIPPQVQCAALPHDQLNINYTPTEAMRAMGQVLLPTSQAFYKGNLKNGRTYLQCVQPLSPPLEPQLCVVCPTQDRSLLRTIYPNR